MAATNRKWMWLTGVLAVAAAGLSLYDRFAQGPTDGRIGKSLVAGPDIVGLTRIDIGNDRQTVELTRDATDQWQVRLAGADRGFAADASKIAKLLDDLQRIRPDHLVARGTQQFGELGLDAATRVILKKNDTVLSSWRFGNSRSQGGQYVAPGSEDLAYLTTESLRVYPDAESWEARSLLRLKEADVKAITFAPAASLKKSPVSLVRDKPEAKFQVEGLGEKEKVKEGALGEAAGVLSDVQFSKRLDASNIEARNALATPSTVQIQTFSGESFEVKVGHAGKESTQKSFLQLSGPPRHPVNQLMEGNAFEVQRYVAERFERGRSDFVE